jgi:hypothetical protein
MIKRLFFLSVMMSAVGVPYLLSASSDWWTALKGRFASTARSTEGAAAATGQTLPPSPGGVPLAPGPVATKGPIEGYGRYNLIEVLDFDGTPEWVMARWPRVTVGLAELDMQGYRMPLVTGTGEEDLAGSLTYYFDRTRRVKLVHFRGMTGNPRKLITLMTQRYGFAAQPSGDPNLLLYQVKWNGKPTSELRIRTAQVLRASEPNARYQVELAMKRP